MAQVTFRINNTVTDWLKKKGDSVGIQAKKELTRFFLITNNIRFEQFTKDELLLICEVFNPFNGVELNFATDIKSDLMSYVKAFIKCDDLDKKYKIDSTELLLKLDKLETISIVALMDRVEQFWFNEKTYKPIYLFASAKIKLFFL